MGTSIPEGARIVVKVRSDTRCERCGVPAPSGEWHHRRSRRVVDVHRHCACNGTWLCGTCHRWVHSHPLMARLSGHIMSMHEKEPALLPIHTPWGERLHDCVGNYEWMEQEDDDA